MSVNGSLDELIAFNSSNASRITSDETESSNEFWGLNDRDVPILIGAVAGALGLVFLILGAVLIWLCCQFAIRRDKSVYSLDNESDGDSCSGSTRGSQQFGSESIIFVGVKNVNEDPTNNNNGIKRSRSAPLNALLQNGLESCRIDPSIGNKVNVAREMKTFGCSTQFAYTNMSPDLEPVSETNAEGEDDKRRKAYRCNSRRHLYMAEDNRDNFDSLRTRSLPWRQSKRISAEAEDIEDLSYSTTRVNFTKKRRNRMRNDSAAAIAMNISGEKPAPMPFLHKDTDSLVDNEAVVVYDERTAL